ncbi:hypothetical protein, partial [Fodinibius roseus]|uniref:hypothetical protein n=1 Tax=Fodinibius roseus TaxID=1194090 RepID=UPI001B8B5C95
MKPPFCPGVSVGLGKTYCGSVEYGRIPGDGILPLKNSRASLEAGKPPALRQTTSRKYRLHPLVDVGSLPDGNLP